MKISRRELLRKTRLAAVGAAFGGVLSTLFPEMGLASTSTALQPGVDAAGPAFHQLGPNATPPGNQTSPGFEPSSRSKTDRGL